MELDEIRGVVVTLLKEAGVSAVTAWEKGNRLERDTPVVSVSLRGCGIQPVGLANYLGEKFDEVSGKWEEIYGRKAVVTLGLDIYASVNVGEDAVSDTFDKVATALTASTCEGLKLETISCGETEYNKEERLMKRSVEAECQLYFYGVRREGDSFLDFRVKGGFTT